MKNMQEFEYIKWLRSQISRSKEVLVGLGDDAAILKSHDRTLLTVDMLMDGVHFNLSKTSPELIGRKALAVNLSDIAAMAGEPIAALVSFAVPRKNGSFIAKKIFTGIKNLADIYNVSIIGGDTNSWNGPLVISITVCGKVTNRREVLRSGAKPGDSIFVTGMLGGSILGKHLSFKPRVKEALAIHKQCKLHSMIDLSDGLISDLRHILEESHCGAVLDLSRIPISAAAKRMIKTHASHKFISKDLIHALTDGEDFELCFTLPQKDSEKLKKVATRLKLKVTMIGEIMAKKGLYFRNKNSELIPFPKHLTGYIHKLS